MKLLSTLYRNAFLRPLLAAVFFVAGVDFWFETNGLPSSWHPQVKAILQHAGLRGSFTHLRIGAVNGVVMLNPEFFIDTPAGPMRLAANDIHCRPNLWRLLQGKLVIDDFAINDAEVSLLQTDPSEVWRTTVSLAQGRRGKDDRFHLQVKAACEGVNFTGAFTLANFSQIASLLDTDRSQRQIRFNPSAQASVASVAKLLKQCRWGENDAFVNLKATLDCLEPSQFALNGDFSLGHALLGPIMITKLRGDCSLKQGQLAFTRLQWFLSRSEIVQGNVELDLKEKTVAANLHGQLFPATLLHLAHIESGNLSSIATLTTPIHFTAKLPSSPLEWQKLNPRLECHFNSMPLYGLQIHRGRFVLVSTPPTIAISELHLSLNPANTEWLAGDLTFNLNTKTIAAELNGELPVFHHARHIGLQLPTAWFGAERRNLKLHLDMKESPIASWQQWHATATAETRYLPILDASLYNPKITLELKNAVLTMTSATAGLPGLPADAVHFTASASLADLVDSKPTAIAFSARVLAHNPGADADSFATALDWQGEAVCDVDKSRLSVTSRGTVFPDRIYQTYQTPLKLPADDIVGQIRCPKNPVSFSLDMPETEIAGSQNWKVLAQLHSDGGSFGKLDLAEASCLVEITPHATNFLDLKGVTAAGEPLALEILIQYDPFVLTLNKIMLTGRPEIAEVFIFPKLAKDIYQQIWEHVTWDPNHPPVVTVPSLVYQSGSTDSDWQLTMASSLTAQNVLYRGNHLGDVALEVHLDLPYGLKVAPITVTRPDGDVNAEIAMTFAGVPQCDLKINKSEGTVDPKQILLAINPDWISFLEPITFSSQTKVTCEGSFFLSGEPLLTLRGTLETPQCSFQDFSAEQVTANWTLSSNQVRWDVIQASYLGGNLKTSGLYDLESRAGNILLIADNVSLDQFSTKLGLTENSEGASSVPGVIQAECRLDILRNWASRPFHVEGNGHVAVRNAQLWEVPLFTKLGYLLELTTFSWLRQKQDNGLGKITSLDADLEFLGTRLVVPQFSTNGTIIALSGEGEYSWEKDRLFFQVSGEALKEVSILSFVLKPLTWAFHAELSGTRKKNEWKLRTALRKIFSTD